MGDGSVLDTDSFLMKGERVPPGTRWGGNPATEITAAAAPADLRSRGRTDAPRLAA
jgi:hypothetical protein